MHTARLSTLLEQSRTGNLQERLSAIEALADLGAPDAVSALIELLQSPDDAVRYSAAHALATSGKHDVTSAAQALMAALSDRADIVRSEAATSLGILVYAPAANHLRERLRVDPEPLVRASAAEALGDIRDTMSVSELLSALQDEDEAVRAYAANSLGLVGAPELLRELRERVQKETSPRVRGELFAAQARLGDSEALVHFGNLLDVADSELLPALLNSLEDLFDRRTPSIPPESLDGITAALQRAAMRLPSVLAHTQQLQSAMQRHRRP
jgi:HEAT repeat protein